MVDDERAEQAELIRRFRAGDEEAFQTLLARCRDALLSRIRQRLPAKLDRRLAASDVLQESLVVAFRRREDLEDRGPDAFRNWLLGIAENRARDLVRRHDGIAKRSLRREVTRANRLATGEYASRQASPSEVAIGAELRELAKTAMSSLPEDYREVLRLAREERLSLKEIAERMGRSHEAVKKLSGRALCRFREEFRRLRGQTDG